jgi:hypothetical protein
LGLELPVDHANLVRDLSGPRLVEALGRHVHDIGDVLEAAVPERALGRDCRVLRRRQELEAVGGLRLEGCLRPDLEQMELVALVGALARLERVKSALDVLAASGPPEVIFEPSQLAGFLSPQVEEVLALLEALNVKLHSSPTRVRFCTV